MLLRGAVNRWNLLQAPHFVAVVNQEIRLGADPFEEVDAFLDAFVGPKCFYCAS